MLINQMLDALMAELLGSRPPGNRQLLCMFLWWLLVCNLYQIAIPSNMMVPCCDAFVCHSKKTNSGHIADHVAAHWCTVSICQTLGAEHFISKASGLSLNFRGMWASAHWGDQLICALPWCQRPGWARCVSLARQLPSIRVFCQHAGPASAIPLCLESAPALPDDGV